MHYESLAPVAFQWSLSIDLQADFSAYVYAALKRAGFKDADKKQAVYQYYNLLNHYQRLIVLLGLIRDPSSISTFPYQLSICTTDPARNASGNRGDYRGCLV